MTLKNIRGNFPLEDPVQHALQSMDHVSYINGLASCFLFFNFHVYEKPKMYIEIFKNCQNKQKIAKKCFFTINYR